MTEKRFTYMIDEVFDLWEIYDNKEKVICLVRNTDAKNLCDLLNELHEENKKLKPVNEMLQMDFAMTERNLMEENEQLKQRCKELRNDLIDHSALINMLEKVKALNIEDIIWNTMGYKTQTEFDDDFADYREYAKKRWKE